MSENRHGKIEKWVVLHTETGKNNRNKAEIQVATASDNTQILQILKWLSPIEKKWGFSDYKPTYKGLRAMINGLVLIHGVDKVEKSWE